MDELKVLELKAILNFAGKPTSGTKAVLIQRIESYLSDTGLTYDELRKLMQETAEEQGSPQLEPEIPEETSETLNENVQQFVSFNQVTGNGHSKEPIVTNVPRRVANKGMEHEEIFSAERADPIAGNENRDKAPQNSELRRSSSLVSVASSRASSNVSRWSSASAFQRHRSAVNLAKMRATRDKRKQVIEQVARLDRLKLEAEEAELEAEEREWRKIEGKRNEEEEEPEPDTNLDKGPEESNTSLIQHPPSPNYCRNSNRLSRRDKFVGFNNHGTSSQSSDGKPIYNDWAVRDLLRYNDLAHLPKREIETFEGRIDRYILFKTAFKKTVGNCSLSNGEKLYYLYQYTEDMPKKIVESCLYLDESRGYDTAWELLDDKYGCYDLINYTSIQKLLSHDDVPGDDAKALDEYAVELVMTRNAAQLLPHGKSELNNPNTVRTIVSKLSKNLQDSWSRRACKLGKKIGRTAGFDDVLAFIRDEADAMNSPQYGKRVMDEMWMERKGSKKTVVGVNKPNVACLYCDGAHDIRACRRLKQLSHEEKSDFLRKNNLCFMCQQPGHMARNCTKPERCQICSGWHATLMHRDQKQPSSREQRRGWQTRTRGTSETLGDPLVRPPREFDDSSGSNPSRAPVMSSSSTGSFCGRLAVVPVSLGAPNGSIVKTFALLDNGSAITMCSTKLLSDLELLEHIVPTVGLTIETVIGECNLDGGFTEGLVLRSAEGDETVKLPPVYSVKDIPITRDDAVSAGDIIGWNHLRGLNLPSVGKVEMIIGANVPAASEPLEVLPAPRQGQPYAVRTRLGWVACGVNSNMKVNTMKVTNISLKNGTLHDMVQRAFDVGFEDVGSCENSRSGEDQKWMDIVTNGCKRISGRYQIPLPLRTESSVLPDTRTAALRRLHSLQKKLSKNQCLCSRYTAAINDLINMGYAEVVPTELMSKKNGVWYIPHFFVFNPMKPEKTRVVFDCAAKVGGVCLNDLLLSGPVLGNELLDVLLRFREGNHAYTADIEAMFHQVSIPNQHRDYLRFLWCNEVGGEVVDYRMTVHLFGASSSPSVAAFALQQAAKDFRDIGSGEARTTVFRNFYVDDCMKSGENVNSLIACDREVRELCHAGGFNLRKHRGTFGFPKTDDCDIETGDEDNVARTLGVMWDMKEDTFSSSIPSNEIPENRRTLLSAIASIFDPLGVLAPFVLRGRYLLQESFRLGSKADWDSHFTQEFMREVVAWFSNIADKCLISVPRGVLAETGEDCSYQLHLFSDASNRGYSAVAYLRSGKGEHCSELRFVWGKCRVNPLKDISVPRLELVAAVLATKMKTKLTCCLTTAIAQVFLWTDSTTVLRYIQNERDRFNVFVGNRITLIRERTRIDEWRYVPSEENPADDGSRCHQTDRWLLGPEFLRSPRSEWPEINLTDQESPLELKVPIFTAQVTNGPTDKLLTYFSSWDKLITGVCWLLEFGRYLLQRGTYVKGKPTVQSRQRVKLSLVQYEQRKYFGSEIEKLSQGHSIGKGSRLWKLDVFMDEELVRVGGRLRHVEADFSEKHPVVLPKESILVDLIVMDKHWKLGHMGVGTTLTEVREQYWITQGHSAVRKIVRKCVVCRRVKGSVIQQKMSDLPSERIENVTAPFTNTGVDCFGPFLVSKGRRTEKRYGVLFTCLSMRAIHLEVAVDLSTDAMCNAVRRFMARRGSVRTMLSDNGTNFRGCKREIMQALSSEEVRNRLKHTDLQWRFNPPGASHFGGVWERLIRVVRRVLEAMLGKQTLTDDGLRTLLCEVEVAVNSRPLTLLSADPNDLTALTPNKLLMLGRGLEPWDNTSSNGSYSRKRWRQIQHLADNFWKRWCREYRVLLQERRKWIKPQRNVKIGDTVVVVDETEARCHWPLGHVRRVFEGKDGLVRSVEIFSRGRLIQRPVSKLVMLLECEELI